MVAEDADIAARVYERLRTIDRSEGGIAVGHRLELLARLEERILASREAIVQAIDADFGGRSVEETLLGEILGTVSAIRHARRRLRRWARPRPVGVGLPFWPARAWVVPQPLGVVGIVAPWNYPLLLALSPTVCALAAGNRVAIKPSELTPRTAGLLDRLVEAALGPDIAGVVQGGPDVAAAFVRQPFDHLLFTGSTERGREVAMAAARNLTPVTLELGGKCPALVMRDADLGRAARSIIQGKGLNAGQTCVAPDIVLLVGVDPNVFHRALRAAWHRHYPNGLPTAVIGHAAARVSGLAQEGALETLGEVASERAGGGRELHVAPSPAADSQLLDQEIFAPILPVLSLPDLDAALAWLRGRPTPLAVYLFTRDRRCEQAVLDATRSGALVVNGTMLQAAIDGLAFGGVGASGSGRYRGRAGFDGFSNLRVHVRASRFNLARFGDPPYGAATRRLIDRLLA